MDISMHFQCGRIVIPEPENCSLQNNASSDLISPGNEGDSHFKVIVELYLMGFLCIFGIFGNFLSVVVMRRDRERKETLFLLQVLALVDGLYLVTGIMRYPLKYLINEYAYETMQLGVLPLLKTFQTICIWTMVLVTIDRYIYVCHPLRAQMLFTSKSRRLWALGIFTAGILYNIPRFFDSCITTFVLPCGRKPIGGMVYRNSFANSVYFVVYRHALYILLLYIIPLTVLTFMNCRLVCAIKHSRKQHAHCAHTSYPQDPTYDNRATTFLIIIVIIFIMCESLEPVIHFLSFLEVQMKFKIMSLNYLNIYTISALLMIVNSSINFVIYIAFGKRFRFILKETFKHSFMTTTSLFTRETVPLQGNQANGDAQGIKQVIHFANNQIYRHDYDFK